MQADTRRAHRVCPSRARKTATWSAAWVEGCCYDHGPGPNRRHYPQPRLVAAEHGRGRARGLHKSRHQRVHAGGPQPLQREARGHERVVQQDERDRPRQRRPVQRGFPILRPGRRQSRRHRHARGCLDEFRSRLLWRIVCERPLHVHAGQRRAARSQPDASQPRPFVDPGRGHGQRQAGRRQTRLREPRGHRHARRQPRLGGPVELQPVRLHPQGRQPFAGQHRWREYRQRDSRGRQHGRRQPGRHDHGQF